MIGWKCLKLQSFVHFILIAHLERTNFQRTMMIKTLRNGGEFGCSKCTLNHLTGNSYYQIHTSIMIVKINPKKAFATHPLKIKSCNANSFPGNFKSPVILLENLL